MNKEKLILIKLKERNPYLLTCQECDYILEALENMERLQKIEQIVTKWNNDASHSFEDMCRINGILKE